ncbi:CBS domain-containing protein [Roseococcus sp. YIM B11640]|uniref:CBS domain-containing protein n=1 Tax=Roseococcus sp. YIM B11640 TaxID=3133973 RepID=UPI003C7D4344
MTIPAKSVMTKDVVTASPETTIAELARRMLKRGVSALPVVDAQNRPLGVVSEGDVLRHFSAGFQSKRAQWLHKLAEGEAMSSAFLAEIGLEHGKASGLMHSPAIVASEEASLAELSDLMIREKIKHVLIVRDGVLVGIVSRADVVRAVVENLQDLLEPTV